MAFYTNKITSSADQQPQAKIVARLKAGFAGILAARNKSADVARMQSLSDDDLGRIGLSRKDIMRHVYSDIYYV